MGIAHAGNVVTEDDGLALSGTWAAGVASAGEVIYGGDANDWAETDTGQLRGFYIAANGNDANPGSKTQPWATVAHVNGFAAQPGDAFMFSAGDTFTDGIVAQASGTSANPIFYRSYGRSDEVAIIQPSSGHGIHVLNQAYIHASNLKLVGGPNANGVMLEANSYDLVKYAGCAFQNLEITGFRIRGILITNTRDDDGSTPGNPPLYNPGFTNLLIDNCYIHDNNDGIQSWTNWTADYVNRPDPRKLSHTNVTISNCVVCNNDGATGGTGGEDLFSGNAIVMGGVDGALVENCVGYGNGLQTPSNGGSVGMWCYDCNNVVFRLCESYNNWSNGTDGDGFDIDGGATNCIIEYCYSHGNYGNGLQYWVYEQAPPTNNNTYRFCITENDGVGIGGQQGAKDSICIGQSDNGTYGTITFHNCVVYQTNTQNFVVGRISFWGNPAPANIENCILIAGPGVPFTMYPSDPHTYTNNNFVGSPVSMPNANNNPQMWPAGLNNAGNGGTIAPVGEALTQEMVAAWTPYQLTAVSQNIGQGAALGFDPGPQDMFGNSLAGSALSIGAECPFATPPPPQADLFNIGNASVPGWTTTTFGYTVYTTGSHDPTGIPNAAPAAVYNDCVSGTTITLKFTGYDPQKSYFVRCHFGEVIGSAAGNRIFNLALNGVTFASNRDTAGEAPSTFILVIDSGTASPASDGSLTVVVSQAAGGAWAPIISGVEIHPA